MGDFHFIVRHALTGVVLFGFALLGCWMFHPSLAGEVAARLAKDGSVAMFVAVAPIVGIVIQGVHVLGLALLGSLFRDPARAAVAEIIRKTFPQYPNYRMPLAHAAYEKLLFTAPDESFFVWLYYTNARDCLIDWARRRRSYYYLGVNMGLAAFIGTVAGCLVAFTMGHLRPPTQPLMFPTSLSNLAQLPGAALAFVMGQSRPSVQSAAYPAPLVNLFIFAGIALWILCSWWLARLMKHDVDKMELFWVCTRLNPALGEAISQKRIEDVASVRQPAPEPAKHTEVRAAGVTPLSPVIEKPAPLRG